MNLLFSALSLFAFLNFADAKDFVPLRVLPEGERERSESGSYIYLFIEVAPTATSCSLYQIDINTATSTIYKAQDLLKLVESCKGSCKSAVEASGRVAFLCVTDQDSRLCLRIPLSEPLVAEGKLDLRLYFFQDHSVQGRFYLGLSKDFQQAVEIFVRDPATTTHPNLKATLTLSGEELAKFLKGALDPQKGVISSK